MLAFVLSFIPPSQIAVGSTTVWFSVLIIGAIVFVVIPYIIYAMRKPSWKAPDANIANSLEGKISGITITPSAGGAGGASKIVLRGNKSIMGENAPLIVIDGVPMTNSIRGQVGDAASLTSYGSAEGSDPLSLINPDDIESMNVLKGANAAALYGSRAANGVVMITTKKGKEGKMEITFNSNTSFETPLTTPKFQNSYGGYRAANGG